MRSFLTKRSVCLLCDRIIYVKLFYQNHRFSYIFSPRINARFSTRKSSVVSRFNEAKTAFINYHEKWKENLIELMKLTKKASASLDVQKDTISKAEQCVEFVKIAEDTLNREKMKVVFLGRTSHGKTTLINGYLSLPVPILPSGQGHTTDCFIQVEGSNIDKPQVSQQSVDGCEILVEVKDLSDAKTKLKSMADSFEVSSAPPMTKNDLIKVYLPVTLCQTLNHDLTLLDCPGLGLSDNSDLWIQDRYKGADMFVLALRNDDDLSKLEIGALKTLKSSFDVPELLIVNTKWDKAYEKQPSWEDNIVEKHKQRRTNWCQNLLTDELKLCNEIDSKERIFFVSSTEAVMDSLKIENDVHSSPERDERRKEFERFKEAVLTVASETAVRKKLLNNSPCNPRHKIIQEMSIEILDNLINSIQQNKTINEVQKLSIKDKLAQSQVTDKVLNDFKLRLYAIAERTKQEIEIALAEKIKEFNEKIISFSKVTLTRKDSLKFLHAFRKHINETLKTERIQLLSTVEHSVEAINREMLSEAILISPIWAEPIGPVLADIRVHSFNLPQDINEYCHLAPTTSVITTFGEDNWKIVLPSSVGGGTALLLKATGLICFPHVMAIGAAALTATSAFALRNIFFDDTTLEKATKHWVAKSLSQWLLDQFQFTARSATTETSQKIVKAVENYNRNLDLKMAKLNEEERHLNKLVKNASDLRSTLESRYEESEKLVKTYISDHL